MDNEELKATVKIRHTDAMGQVRWSKEYEVADPSDPELDLNIEEDKAILQFPRGLVALFLHPGDRIEAYVESYDEVPDTAS